MSHAQQVVQKLWNYCNVLRDDGLSYGDYVEQLTYPLFLKMAHEQTQPPWRRPSAIPAGYDWPSLTSKDGDALEAHYRHILETLGKRSGMLGIIFRKAQNRIQDPAKLRRLIADLIDRERWRDLDADVMGDAYEGFLEKNAQDTKGGTGQYFTPRPLIRAIVDMMRPAPGETLCDPASGTGGFLLAAHDYILQRVMESMAYVAAVRSAFLVHEDPNDPRRRLLLHAKNNKSSKFSGRAFRIIDGAVRWEPLPVEMTANQLLAAEEKATKQKTEVDRAADFLVKILTDGPKPAEAVFEAGDAEGFSQSTLNRAKRKAHAQSDREAGYGAECRWMWSLSPSPLPVPEEPQPEKPDTFDAYGGEALAE